MPIPVLKSLSSIQLDSDALPPDPSDCVVTIDAEIGFGDLPGADRFSFDVVSPSALARDDLPRWGRGYLLVPEFSWDAVRRAVAKLLLHADRATWPEAASELGKEMRWEFEHYAP